MLEVVKRDGSRQRFSSRKVGNVLAHVLDGQASVQRLTERVIDRLEIKDGLLPVDKVQDAIEAELIASGFANEAKGFIRYRMERDAMRERRGSADVAAFAESIVASKYTRWMPEEGRRETWDDAVDRMMDMHVEFWTERLSNSAATIHESLRKVLDWIEECRTAVKDRKVVGSMRALQMGGSKILKHNDSMYNCTFTHLSSFEQLQKAFFRLLCGSGVGYSVQWHHVDQLPKLVGVDNGSVNHHTVEDTIEGWADALGVLFQSYTVAGKNTYVEFDYSSVRGEGSPLKTTGGTAPGHLGLKKGLEAIRGILNSIVAEGGKVRPIHAHDIMCHAASAVLSGGVRRSAMLALFSPNDGEMMMAKSPGHFSPQYPGSVGVNSQREFANNSVALLRSEMKRADFKRVLDLCRQYGEPGFFFTDDLEYGPNPCGEINMLPLTDGTETIESKNLGDEVRTGFGFCNLTEINGAAVGSEFEFFSACRIAAILGTLQAGYTKFRYLGGSVDAEIASRDALLGVSITGIMNNPEILLDSRVLTDGAAIVKNVNEEVASVLGINTAARLTCVKPSGTASKALGVHGQVVGPGIHGLWSRRWIQGVTYKRSEPILKHVEKYSPVQVTYKPNGDAFVEWPLSCNDASITMKDLDAIQQLENIGTVYRAWVKPGTRRGRVTHNVSCTVTVRDDEWEAVEAWIWENRGWLAALTFVPDLLEIKYPYAPYRAVMDATTEGRWNELVDKMVAIDWTEFGGTTDLLDPACAGGACLV